MPRIARQYLLKLAHDDEKYRGHLGIKKTYRKLLRFWWPRMNKDVERYVKSCDTCQRFKNPPRLPSGLMHSISVSQIFEHLHLDIVGPIKTTHKGNTCIITATDAFSKWAFAKPVCSTTTKDIIKFLEDYILTLHGSPKCIITDQGWQFISKDWKDYITEKDIEHKMTTAYHAQTNGIDERLNGTLVRILRTYVNESQQDWDEKIKWALFVYNTTIHESTGYSPYQLIYGFDPRSPLKPDNSITNQEVNIKHLRNNIRQNAHINIERAQRAQMEDYNRRHKTSQFEIGQLVLIRVNACPIYLSKKFYQNWQGPYMITGFVGNSDNPKSIIVFDYQNMVRETVAISQIKPYVERDLENKTQNISNQKEKSEGQASDTSVAQDKSDYYLDYSLPNWNTT